jgi:hypothetical protein
VSHKRDENWKVLSAPNRISEHGMNTGAKTLVRGSNGSVCVHKWRRVCATHFVIIVR